MVAASKRERLNSVASVTVGLKRLEVCLQLEQNTSLCRPTTTTERHPGSGAGLTCTQHCLWLGGTWFSCHWNQLLWEWLAMD